MDPLSAVGIMLSTQMGIIQQMLKEHKCFDAQHAKTLHELGIVLPEINYSAVQMLIQGNKICQVGADKYYLHPNNRF